MIIRLLALAGLATLLAALPAPAVMAQSVAEMFAQSLARTVVEFVIPPRAAAPKGP